MSSTILRISGLTVSVTRKSALKNLYIKVCPPDGDVKVSSPLSISDSQIEMFVREKLPEIEKYRVKLASRVRQSKREYVSGEAFYLWGKPYMLQVVTAENSRSKVQSSGGKLILSIPKDSSVDFRKRKIDAWYRNELKAAINNMADSLQRKIGVKASEFRIKNMKTRWGTCNVETARIWINLQLAKKPPECLEYVLVHELCHLIEKNHSKQFYALVEQFCPGWREAKKMLDEMPLDCYEGY